MKVSSDILSLVPYKPGKPISETQREYGLTKVIKLASNENPLGPSPMAVEAMTQALQNLHRYPDPAFYELMQLVSKQWRLPTNMLSAGNGSNEIIDVLIRVYCEPGEAILTTEAAFIAYQICAQAARVKTYFTPLKSGFQMDLTAMANFLKTSPDAYKVKLIFLPNPNNPTGTYVKWEEVKNFLDQFGSDPDRLIIFDEAYTEYARAKDYRSPMEDMSKYPSVVVIRTLSKAYGLAGLRVGLLVAPPHVIDLYNRVRNTFNVNEIAQVAAVAALQDADFLRKSQQVNWDGLDYFYEELRKMNLPFVESQANFVMFDTRRDVVKVNEALLKRGVILRPILNYGFKTQMRMSVGLPEENRFAIEKLREVLQEIPAIT